MATNFPSSLDNLSNPTGSSALTSPDHAGQHADANDAIEALEAKVGVNGSAVTTSLDYKVENGVFPKLNVDSGVLFVDATNNRVGVNTTGPTDDFQVNGSMSVDAGTLKVDSANNRVGVNTNSPLYTLDVNGDLSVDSGVLRVDATNNRVGINNIVPTVALDVTGDGRISGDLTVDTSTFRVDSTNNRVGINVSVPIATVDVIGSATIRAGSGQDGVSLSGRAGGLNGYSATFTPTTLTANRTITIPDASGTLSFGAIISRTIYNSTISSVSPFPTSGKGALITLIGGGGAGGGCALTNAGTVSIGQGGVGGQVFVIYADESQYSTNLAGKSFNVVIGSGGIGTSGAGGSGGTTSLKDSLTNGSNLWIESSGGGGGSNGSALTPPYVTAFQLSHNNTCYSSVSFSGRWAVPGNYFMGGMALSTTQFFSGSGGCSPVLIDNAGSGVTVPLGNRFSFGGASASGYGIGGSGAANGVSQASTRSGGNGSAGRIEIIIYG